MFVTDNADAFQHLFIDTLRNMLSPHQAGAFILVLANSMQSKKLRNDLWNDIETVFTQLRSNIRNNNIAITDDDLSVFQGLEKTGIGSLMEWKVKNKGPWKLVFNPLRALRPARASTESIEMINRAFDDNTFNFNKAFLRPEILWESDWQGRQMRVLYNKFPFAPYHLIIVPDPELRLPQYLTTKHHAMMWELLQQQQYALPGFGVGYNSLGACASVNQLHFQSFVSTELLPVEQQQWKHNVGDDQYPMNCQAFDSIESCWQLIDRCHQNNQPYNLLYRPDRCYVIPRLPQGSTGVAPRVSGAGWIEQCGVFNVSDQSELESLSAEEINACLSSLSVSAL